MKEKKKSADWYIAATHWLTSVISSTIFDAITLFLLVFVTQNTNFIVFAVLVLQPVVMWFAVKYSARFINRRYVISDPQKIVIPSLIYFLVVNGGYQVYDLFTTGVLKVTHVAFVFSAIVFYIVSKKYIKSEPTQPALK